MIRFLQSLVAWLLFTAVLTGAVHFATILYIPGFIMNRAMERVSEVKGVNAVSHAPAIDDTARMVVRPSPDLLYTTCVFNLAQQNLRVKSPVPDDGYWSVSMFDDETNTFFVRNNVEGSGQPLDLLLIGPGSSGADGETMISAPSFKGIILFRRLIEGRAELPRYDAERREVVCDPEIR